MNWSRFLMRFAVGLAVAYALAPQVSSAPLITVGSGCTFPTIAAGIAAAGPGGTVYLEGGWTFEEHLVINKNLTLKGGYTGCATGSSEPTVINGNWADRIIEIAGGLEVRLEHLALYQGSTDASGGGILFAQSGGGLLVLENVAIRNCNAGAGGGVWIGPNAEMVGSNLEFESNSADHGGAIRLYGGRATLRNSTFLYNRADKGGAIAAIEAFDFTPELSLTEGTALHDNEALTGDGLGGALYVQDGQAVFAWDTLVERNRAVDGGGIALVNGILRGGGHFHGNLADGNGGAIHANESTVEMIDGPLFSGNDATSGGAALLIHSSVMRLQNGAVRGNNASGIGGAFMVTMASSLEITRTSSDCHWSSCHQLTGNTAGNTGGAIHARGVATVHVDGQLLANNSAEFGGALSLRESDATVRGCVFTGNDATSLSTIGDAVYATNGSSFSGTGVTFAYNDRDGGASGEAIHLESGFDPVSLDLTASIIWGHGLSINDVDQSVTCSDIEGGYVGAGNISVDPQFVSPVSLDYHLEPTSPLIDRCAVPGGRSGDWDWQVRPWVVDEPATPYDMGADEVGSVSIRIFTDGFESGDISEWAGST